MKEQHRCDGMLTIECQLPQSHVLSKDEASELTALVARDLAAVLGINQDSALVFCAATFGSEQLLQPQFPIQAHISQYASAAFQGTAHDNQVLSIGASNGRMPSGLTPTQPSQALLHMPFCLFTQDRHLAEQFEAQLMHKGMVSPPTYAALNSRLNTTGVNVIKHANYMTYLDLVAMMHNHYEHLGLGHLWQIIETALVSEAPKTAVQTPIHNHFFLVDHLLFTPFFSWSQFRQHFATEDTADYITWLMAQRLSLGAFATHGLSIRAFQAETWPLSEERVCLGQFEQQRIKRAYWTERHAIHPPHPDQAVYHMDEQAGVVAVSWTDSATATTTVHYPVTPQGIGDIEQQLPSNTQPAIQQPLTDNPEWLT
ncbi:hypothetical protein [Marinicella meishanensis]|uniref:hypothetical protein n=1 Tax=Marinicella meishanensis TaxID=2873263 RepID=UPI001CC0383C|nr:hypothetical protein [Marinicella sp. NBU2979]